MRNLRWIAIAAALVAAANLARAQGPGKSEAGRPAPSPEMRQRMEQFRKFREEHKYTFQLTDTIVALGELEKQNRHALTPAQAKKVNAVLAKVRKQPKLTQEQAKQALKEVKAPLTERQLTEVGKITKEMSERRGRPDGAGPRPGGRPDGAAARPGGQRPGGRPDGDRPGARRPGDRPDGAASRPGGQRPGGRPDGAGQRPGGDRPGGRPDGDGPGARRPAFDPARMKDFNPLAAPSGEGAARPRGNRRLQEAVSLIEKKATKK
ncbi:MAG TPA: hypothetical protein PLY56_04145 [Armatimonadota bacterium]|jgi:hypothetical protein|nr:hypothetical protein [Armatimonadota bacterium]HOM82671.1 hypothetical protein [Armatimonadota bacterium]HPO73432.1 hypothetical protein [Armatimonadota bacterium]